MKYVKFSIFVIAGFFLFICNSIKISAAERDTLVNNGNEYNDSVTIANEYKEAIFNFEFDVEQDYFIEIVDPKGGITYKNQTESYITVSVKDVTKGTYTISIYAKDAFEVNAHVECKNTNVTNVGDGNLTISSSFSGLKTYFLDGALMVEWDDTNLGKVTIEVTNPKTMQKIAKTTVEKNVCKINIPSNVKEIEVYVVPTSSAKVNGAGVSYTLTVIRDVNGEVEIPDITLTNKDYVELKLKNDSKLKVVTTNNNIEVLTEEFEIGEHILNVPLTATINDVVVYLIDEKGNMVSSSFSIEKDLIAPAINISEEYNDMNAEEKIVTVTGYANQASAFYVNNIEVELSSTGKFTCDVELAEGINPISLCATDDAGNETVLVFNVLYENSGNTIAKFFLIGFVFLFILLFTLLIIKKVSGKKTENISNENISSETSSLEQPVVEVKEKNNNLRNTQEKKVSEEKITTSEKKEHKEVKKMKRRQFIPSVIVFVVQIICVLIVFNVMVMPSHIISGSMEPTLMTNDLVFYNKLAYVVNDIERGDIVNFWSDEYENYFSKRVIGVAGDVIEFHDGYVFINGAKADESAYLAEGVETNCSKTFTVPEGTVFVMGDNRENSVDSRFFKEPFIPTEKIVGKYLGQVPNIFE